jgi:hypothetical protein
VIPRLRICSSLVRKLREKIVAELLISESGVGYRLERHRGRRSLNVFRKFRRAMTPDDFRRLALSQPGTVETSRRDHSDFRVFRKSFASFEGPAYSVATIQLTPEQQAMFVQAAPSAFMPVPGGWGRLGATNVVLAHAEEAVVKSALMLAWRNIAPKSLVKSTGEPEAS